MTRRRSTFDFNYEAPDEFILSARWISNATSKSRQSKPCSILRSSAADSFPCPFLTNELIEKPLQTFCTESTYTGTWDRIGMAGYGVYVLPHKVIYEGELQDGLFHGKGTLLYPMGQKVNGIWEKGDLVSTFDFDFTDTLNYTPHQWPYCQMPDRRFFNSILYGLNPVCTERRTNITPPKPIPDGCYDTGDGFYNPINKCVFSSIDPEKIIRIPTKDEETWILKNCRKWKETRIGFRPDLYEKWTTGRRSEFSSEIEIPIEDKSSERKHRIAFQTDFDDE